MSDCKNNMNKTSMGNDEQLMEENQIIFLQTRLINKDLLLD